MKRQLVIASVLLLFMMFAPMIALAQDEIASDPSTAKALVTLGGSLVGSLLLGAFKKHLTPLPNKTIPISNPIVFGGAAAAITSDVKSTALAIGGSILATVAHSGTRAIMKRLE